MMTPLSRKGFHKESRVWAGSYSVLKFQPFDSIRSNPCQSFFSKRFRIRSHRSVDVANFVPIKVAISGCLSACRLTTVISRRIRQTFPPMRNVSPGVRRGKPFFNFAKRFTPVADEAALSSICVLVPTLSRIRCALRGSQNICAIRAAG